MASRPYYKSKTYFAWASMKTRCTNPRDKRYQDYGGRGIKFCKRWDSYDNFYSDMGDKPEGCSLGRVDNNGNYKSLNCRWETSEQQANNTSRNRFIEYQGLVKTLTQWARQFNLKSSTVRQRYYVYGWDIDRCLNNPVGMRG